MEKTQSVFEFLEEVEKSASSEEFVYEMAKSFLEQRARETCTPIDGHFELTPCCNLDCKMCYVHLNDVQMQGKRILSAETWINLMQQAINAGMTRADLSGGECLTYPKFDEVYLFLKSQGIETYILTNGVLLDGERIDFFLHHTPRAIQISLYGNSEEAYERVTGKRVFSRVISNIKAAKDAGLPITIAITPSRYNLDTLKDTIQLAKKLDLYYRITFSLITPRDDTGRDKKDSDIELEDYIEIFKFNHIINKGKLMPQKTIPYVSGRETEYECTGVGCGAGKNSFSIRWDGRMYPCAQMESVIADPIQVGFDAAWEMINKGVKYFPRFKKCEECSYSDACNFCPAENEKMGSKFYLNPIWCERTWKIVENGLVKK